MGNEQSQIPGIEIEQKAIEVSDFWAQHNATVNNLQNGSKLSIFVGDIFLNEPFWVPQTPLERFNKNLMLYRHPSIIRYISSWQKANKFFLAVEEVIPLSHLLAHMTTIEICLGLYSILKALSFLHENADASHNNVCLASIFVTKEGTWKLGGLEYLCRYKHLTAEYLQKSRSHRYGKAIDSNEGMHVQNNVGRKDFVDTFAFCIFAIEILKGKNSDMDILNTFKELCTKVVQEPNVLLRPKLISLLEHELFKHKFIFIHSYLIELPLKADREKTEFFTNLKRELEELDEQVVASQLGRLLVSRMVLLNKTARNCLLPYILIPKNGENSALFSDSVFRKYIAPQLLNIFCVRDAQIRLLLLEYFCHFIDSFTKEELQLQILPELLVGIKDTNNELVAVTLHTLADLVPVLGADVVIGGKRAKLFNDGRPKHHNSSRKSSKNPQKFNSMVGQNLPIIGPESSATSSSVELNTSPHELPERPRPDGEEGETSTEEIEQSAEEDVDIWDDWDNENVEGIGEMTLIEDITDTHYLHVNDIEEVRLSEANSNKIMNGSKTKKIIDITELDIKNQTKMELEQNEIDFFEDMEPVIRTNNKFVINTTIGKTGDLVSSKLSVNTGDVSEEGWGDDWD
ncbi:protein-associating with the carboxyl-terminal domain of ezrin [Euwallacea similis]|uniref:protein-associating with the carboxyl-terminal domain of ezrin n=1 Tax=Euwallacea similis TaxID=1736056 RepID=UPI00344E88F3